MSEYFAEKMNLLAAQHQPFLFVLDFGLKAPLVLELSEATAQGILFDVNGHRNFEPVAFTEKAIQFRKHPVSYDTYREGFDNVMQHIRHGNSFLTNLTFPTPVETNLTFEEIFHRSSARYKLLLPGKCVVFSPEIFVKITDRKIASYPMKGTIDAAIPHAASQILNDKKETAEHNTIVDLIRNDLSMIAKNVHVSRFRYIDEVKTHEKTLLQVSSEITGELPSDYHSNIGNIMAALLPAGSISGAPKQKTVEIIRESEIDERGYYTGVFGIFDGQDLDSAVMIRYIAQENGKTLFRSGGGITVFSEAEKEYQEMIDKVYVPIY
ncbi:aminodeoxychorismate synthase component I [Prolixibacter bellariivorans]|uniref:Aminodeoxychorismate synthase component I n=1 Tax=Prolixibacter bellariivorans TaxID=314319 RepID=A0A5M4B2M9_9BACT|nr:aminodeoxychorismate synthase component I [Prolixibacter bellariivorans]GET34390.1 aminodeoxychorismate synthase component I [Prolixibacter bellariivorans]